jgi:hypothetical protein
MQMLLDKGADPNTAAAKGRTALALAARSGKVDAIRVLLDAGADLNYKDDSGYIAAENAAHMGEVEAALLLEHAMQGSAPDDGAIQEKEQPKSEEGDGISIREADENDLPGIAALLSDSPSGTKASDWARWKFQDNPDGPPWLYIAVDASDTIIGLSARIPRMFTSSRTGEFRMGQNVDMFLAKEYRKKGIHRRITKLGGEKRDYLMIGIPNENSWVRLKGDIDTILPMETWHFPAVISKLIADTPYGFIAPVADLFSRLYSLLWLGPRPRNLQMRQLERFEKDFDVDPEVIRGVRTADYLNWRFIDNPISSYSVYGFFEEEELVGYCVCREVDARANVYDFITSRRQRGCLRLLVDHCREIGISNLRYTGVGLALAGVGFLRHGSIGQCVLSDVKDGQRVPQGRWLVTLADKD